MKLDVRTKTIAVWYEAVAVLLKMFVIVINKDVMSKLKNRNNTDNRQRLPAGTHAQTPCG